MGTRLAKRSCNPTANTKTYMDSISSPLSGSAPPVAACPAGITAQESYALAGRFMPWFGWSAVFFCLLGLYAGLVAAPTDLHQGDHYRIAFIQIPTLWLSVLLYVLMASASAYGLMRKHRIASMGATALAPTGALLAFLALWTGSLWGKPMWGSWWIWDPQLSAELLLLFLFLGFIALQEAIDDPRRADRAAGVLALVGLVGLPLLYFSVSRWGQAYGTHTRGLSIPEHLDTTVQIGLALMFLGLFAYAGAATLARLRNEVLKRERNSAWVATRLGQRR